MQKIEEIADQARNALSKYCIEECKAYCCKKGYIILSQNEMLLLLDSKKERFLKKDLLIHLVDGKFSLLLGNSLGGCPKLKDSKCTIHKNSKRPLTCIEFPIFISEKEIHISKRCFGANQGILYPYTKKIIDLGYKIL